MKNHFPWQGCPLNNQNQARYLSHMLYHISNFPFFARLSYFLPKQKKAKLYHKHIGSNAIMR